MQLGPRGRARRLLEEERESLLGAGPEEIASALESLISDVDRAAVDAP